MYNLIAINKSRIIYLFFSEYSHNFTDLYQQELIKTIGKVYENINTSCFKCSSLKSGSLNDT